MKDILVALDTTDTSKMRLQAALNLAERLDAHVTCFYQERNIDYALYGEPYAAALTEALQTQVQQDNEKITELFDSCTKANAAKCTLKLNKPYPHNAIFEQANLCDLVVSGQLDPEKHVYSDKKQAETIVMASGKPVLIIPYIGFPEIVGNTVMVAWDQSREASRAVHDAIPILKQATKVHIVSIVNKKDEVTELVTVDIAEHLARHDIDVEAHPPIQTDIPTANALLSEAADLGVDLIVMGAYGHSRLREYTLGGTTRTILNSMTVPVLMTH